MDVYDPQTLGIVVFGGFMVFSAIGITLVSTFSMKETSYEEALAKQRQDSSKAQAQRSDKKKKLSEKKGKAKKKDDKPNGNLPDSEPELLPEPVVVSSEPQTVPLVEQEPQAQIVTEPEPEANPKLVVPEPISKIVECTSPPSASPATPPLAPSPKDKRKKKVAKIEHAKVEPAPIKPVEAVIPEMKVEPVVAVAVKTSVALEVSAPPKAEEPKGEPPTKKKSKKKVDAVVSVEVVDVPQPSPYKALVSSLSSASFSESETQKLFEIISKKAGKDSWQLASQKGDPLAAMKKQLEDKDKQLVAEQGNLDSAKTRVRELTKELNSAKCKMTSLETRMSSELSARGQEISALQARMQTSYQDHTNETQQLNSKIQSLQEQLENGPKAQLARLQQENSILRDALNQATSQAESRQNAELAKLRQDCVRINRELSEHKASQNAEEEHRKSLETKLVAVEEQLTQTQVSHVEAEQALQEKLDKVNEELKEAQEGKSSLQVQMDAAKEQAKSLVELQERLQVSEIELKNRCEELETLRAEMSAEKPDVETETEHQTCSSEEVEHLKRSLKEREEQLNALEGDLTQMREGFDAAKRTQAEEIQNRVNEADTQRREYTTELDQLKDSLKEKSDLVTTLQDQLEKMQNSDSAEAEPAFENLEKDARMISLEEELQHLKEEMEQTKSKSNELREKNYTAVEALSAAERLSEERLSQAKAAQSEAEVQLTYFQTQTKSAFQTLFPHISVEAQEAHWLEALTHEAQKSLTEAPAQQTAASSDLTDLQQKLVLSEETQRSLQAECEQYRSTLGQTESMLKLLQKSVEDGELAWKSKMAESEEKNQKALGQVKALEETLEKINADKQDVEKLKEQVMLLEAQLEKQLESITVSQTHTEEMAELQTQLSETRLQLLAATTELSLVQTQLEDSKQEVKTEEDKQQTENTEEALKCATNLETPLEDSKPVEEEPTEELKEAEEVKEGTSV